MLILGGPKNNQITEKFFELMDDKQPAIQNGSTIYWRKKEDDKWIDDGADVYNGEVHDGKVVKDYGLALRTQSPFTAQPRTVVLFCGCHTYGTLAAARYFTERMQGEFRKGGRLSEASYCSARQRYNSGRLPN